MAAKKKKAVKTAAKAKVKKAASKKAVKKVATAKKAVTKKAVTKKASKPAAKSPAKPKAKSATSSTAKKSTTTAKPKTKKASSSPVTAKKAKPVSKPTKAKSKANGDDLSFRNYTPYEIEKGEDYMNEEQIEHFRQILQGWKQQLMDKVDETVHHLQDEAANFPDPNDRASQESEFTLELRTRDRERKLIKKIDESLKALDDDEYGYCTSCGVEVGIRRLEARPTATECIDCKTLNEIREKQYGK